MQISVTTVLIIGYLILNQFFMKLCQELNKIGNFRWLNSTLGKARFVYFVFGLTIMINFLPVKNIPILTQEQNLIISMYDMSNISNRKKALLNKK